jgi:toxin ParE1/3/4
MKYGVSLLRRADRDSKRIYKWLAARSPTGALRWYEALLDALEDLRKRPTEFALADEIELADLDVRQRFFKTPRGRRYRMLFVLAGNQVHVLRICVPGQRPVRPDQLRP